MLQSISKKIAGDVGRNQRRLDSHSESLELANSLQSFLKKMKRKIKNVEDNKIATCGSSLLYGKQTTLPLLKEQGVESELNIIKTQGDRVQNRFLHEIGGKGLFVRELETSMLESETDIGVHSLKDLPAKTPEPFILAAIMKRHEVADALIVGEELFKKISDKYGKNTRITKQIIKDLGKISIATASLRRQSLLKGASDEVEVVPVRGNVDTYSEEKRQ